MIAVDDTEAESSADDVSAIGTISTAAVEDDGDDDKIMSMAIIIIEV